MNDRGILVFELLDASGCDVGAVLVDSDADVTLAPIFRHVPEALAYLQWAKEDPRALSDADLMADVRAFREIGP